MRAILSLILCVALGFPGLGLVFVMDPGWGTVAIGAIYHALLAALLTWWNGGRGLAIWAIVPSWGLGLLGLVGVWISIQDPPSGDWGVAMLFLLGPTLSGLAGGSAARFLMR